MRPSIKNLEPLPQALLDALRGNAMAGKDLRDTITASNGAIGKALAPVKPA